MPVRIPILAALLLLLAGFLPVRTPRAQTTPTPIAFSALPRSTQEHLRASAWWPTKPLASPTGFVGAKVCAGCHSEIVDTQRTSQMARTLTPAADSQVLAGHLHNTFHSGPYTDMLARTATGFGLSVTDGAATQQATLDWAFGSGDVGQSYLWQGADSSFHEARFNYFRSLNTFADTPGRLHGAPASLPMALSREIQGFEAQTCFRCHTTVMSSALPLDTHTVVPGVSCEACHGPGAAHVAAVNAADAADTPPSSAMTPGAPPGSAIPTGGEGPAASTTAERLSILNPSRLTPADSVELCGSCHSTPTDVRLMGAVGLQTVRFPAYRLTGSRCWLASSPAVTPGAGDARLTCQSCHNPHAPLDRISADYDSACLRCHTNRPGPTTSVISTGGAVKRIRSGETPASALATVPGHTQNSPTHNPDIHPAPACPVATSQCTSCHMPKFEIPEMHAKFTDHRIRIAHPGDPFPDTLPTQRAATR